LRLLRYMVRIWEREEKLRAGRLPVILPVVLAHNSERWEMVNNFAFMLDVPPGAEAFVPDFVFRLIQIAEMPFERMEGTPAGILLLRAFKAESLGELLGDELWDEDLIAQALPTFELVLEYILSEGEFDKAAFARKIQTVQNSYIQKTAMTLAQQFRQEGRQEGQIESLQESVIEALGAKFEQVPDGLREAIWIIVDPAKLRALLRTAVRCADVDSFASAL